MADAARNLSVFTMDSKTQDSYSSALMPVIGIVVVGAVGAGVYRWWATRNQQPENPTVQDQSVREPLLQSSTGGRRLTRHRKNRSRKTRAKRRT
jgi:hypothetical protein